MDDERCLATTRSRRVRIRGGAWLLSMAATAVALLGPRSPAADRPIATGRSSTRHTNHFDGKKTSWTAAYDRSRVRLSQHRLIDGGKHNRSYEYLRFDVARRGTSAELIYDLPPARVIEDLELSLWWNSTRAGATLFLRVVFPQHDDPRTHRPMTTLIEAARCETAGKWTKLRGGVTERKVQARIRQLRERFSNPRISSQGMYVNGAVVRVPLDPGDVHVGIAELRFGPIVAPADEKTPVSRSRTDVKRSTHPVEFRLDRLRVKGYPFFPRMAPYHREKREDLKRAGLNVVWVPRYDDASLMASLRAEGLWVTATPPSNPAGGNGATARRMATLGPETNPILFWNMGTRVPASARKELIEWADRLRRRDRVYDRPILADVAGDEAVFSRHVSMLGVSRHMLQTSFSFRQYRDWLIQKRRLARPGSFIWTWIQTEPAGDRSRSRGFGRPASRSNGNLIVIEPEQIRLQVYAALAAGCRGLGFWTTTPLHATYPGAAERRLAISQLNLELDVLTPWIATGKVDDSPTTFTIQKRPADRISRRRLDFATSRAQREALLSEHRSRLQRRTEGTQELQAAVIRSEYGTLLLPVWYETDAQFVPGQMTARNAQIVVEAGGVSQSATPWLVTTTQVRSLEHERVTGGIKITIPRFDQTAAVVVTADRDLVEQLKRRVARTAAASARIAVELAKAKLERVRAVDAELARLGRHQPDAPQLLHRAEALIAEGRSALQRGEFHAARINGDNAMQYLRILQRAHWSAAVQSLSAPVSSPHTLCFQTLPEHWRLISRFGRSRPDRRGNVLRSGNFEDLDTMLAEGWQHSQNAHPAVRAVAELYPKGKQGSYSLRLVAAPVPGKDQPAYLARPPVSVTSPPITVRSGQIVHVSGWVRVATPIVAGPDGAVVSDSLAGPRCALRWNAKSGWQRFTMLREVRESGEMRLTLTLHGLGEVRFDDLRVVLHDPVAQTARAEPAEKSPPRRGLNLLDRLPKLPALPRPFLPGWSRERGN